MKKVILAILLLASCATFSFAQDAAATPKKPKFELTAETMSSVGIAADVQTKILDLTKAADAALKPLRKNKELADDDRKAQIKVIRDKCDNDVQALLTPEQKKKIKEMKKAM